MDSLSPDVKKALEKIAMYDKLYSAFLNLSPAEYVRMVHVLGEDLVHEFQPPWDR